MLKPTVFANASTTVGLVVYVVCRVLSLVAPDLLFTIGQSWFHTINLDSAKATTSMDIGIFVLGGVSVAVLVWLTTFAVATLYNKWAK